jgi:hypothetical protein
MADDETKTLLRQIADYLPKLDAKIDEVRADLKAGIARVESKVDVEARVINARLDEQGRILAAMVPTRLAAVPPERQAS